VKITLKKFPEEIWLKVLAHYLAISAKQYSHYGEVDYDDKFIYGCNDSHFKQTARIFIVK
jgi:hypothetical protein